MIIETSWKNYKKTRDQYDSVLTNEGYGNWVAIAKRSNNIAVLLLIISTIVMLIFIPFAIFFTIHCGRKRRWSVTVMVLLVISFFVPYLGFFTIMFMLIYGIICYSS